MIQDGQQYLLTAPWMMIMLPVWQFSRRCSPSPCWVTVCRDALDVKMKDA